MSELAQKLSKTDLDAAKRAEELKQGQRLEESAVQIQHYSEERERIARQGGLTAEENFDPTLRDLATERRAERIMQRKSADELNALAGKTLDVDSDDHKAIVRAHESTLSEQLDAFGEAEPDVTPIDAEKISWSGRSVAFVRRQFITRSCSNADYEIKRLEKRLSELATQLNYMQMRFDGSEIEDEKMQRSLSYGRDLANQRELWLDYLKAALNIYHEETGDLWMPWVPADENKHKTQAMASAAAFVAAWGPKPKK